MQPKFEETHISSDEDLLCLPYSSGTTGLPKGVMLTHKNLVTVLHNFTDVMKENIYSTLVPSFLPCEQNSILFLPFYHMFGFGTLLNGIYNRETIVVMTKFDFEKFCKYIQDYKIRIAFVTPPVLVYLAKNPIIDKYDLSSLEIVLSSAAPLGKDLYNEVKKRLPTLKHVFQGYGMTEISFFTTLGSIKTPIGSVGALVNGHELKIVDPETGESLGANTEGELWYRSDQVMKGYLNRPKETAATIDSEGWLHSGDIGFIDDNGHVYIVDRLKELIKVKGYQVPPTELEDLLLSHPKVKDCAVVGIPCEIRGEIPKAFIVKKCNTLREDEIHDFVNEKVTKYKRLKGGVSFVSEIPKSPSGKILRRMLR
ncbi:hypothetical protein FO519_009399 [Halicephalobus sp. NKZ332]|nr:hypothetical protein FO519_009399 [Halicephalobus sp. NKZ332]